MNILFICKHNIFRSKIAEAYFKKINKNKNIKVASAGSVAGAPLDEQELSLLGKFIMKLGRKPKKINKRLLKWQDMTVIVADEVPRRIIDKKYNKKTIVWKIPGKVTSVPLIIKRVNALVKQLEDAK